jgi:HAD superfamily hydrolase (TIGR01456 family)
MRPVAPLRAAARGVGVAAGAGRCCRKRPFASLAAAPHHPSPVAVSFDIDGVLLRGKTPLPGARDSLLRLVAAGVPFVFLTNGGGEREWKKAALLGSLLGLPVHPEQVILSHTPLRAEVARFADRRILVLGCREVVDVARSYGATRPVTVNDLCHDAPARYPFLTWEHRPLPPPALADEPIAAVFCLHDPNNWGAELQVTIDALLGGVPLGAGAPGAGGGQAVPYYLSNNDLTFAGVFPVPRLASGAYTRALRHLFREVTGGHELTVTYCGKPTRLTFDYAAAQLARWGALERQLDQWAGLRGRAPPPHLALPLAAQADAAAAVQLPPPAAGAGYRRIYHVGDNPAADVRGANAAGGPWRSVLVRTGVWRGGPGANDGADPAHVVADGVAGAVDAILAEHAAAAAEAGVGGS